jgi:hypothetical protein
MLSVNPALTPAQVLAILQPGREDELRQILLKK